MKKYMVLDAGGTFIKYAVLDEEACILEKGKEPTPSYETHTLEDYLTVLDGIVLPYKEQISGIAVSMPGMLDSNTGYCMSAGYLMYCQKKNMKEILENRFGLPVTIENDGKCAALAEKWRGSLADVENGAVLVIGTGMAGGLILNGRLYRGRHFTAGEYSFMTVNSENAMDVNSYWGFDNGVSGLIRRVAAETATAEEEWDGIRIFEEANAGNVQVLKALDDYTKSLAVQIYNLTILLDLDLVSVGGGISQQPLLLEMLQKNYDLFVETTPMNEYNSSLPKTELTHCTFYNDANLIGALYHFLQKQEEKK